MDPLRTLESLAKSARTIKQSLPYWVDTAFSYVGLVKQAFTETIAAERLEAGYVKLAADPEWQAMDEARRERRERARQQLLDREEAEEVAEPMDEWTARTNEELDQVADRFRSAAEPIRATALGVRTMDEAFGMVGDAWDHRPPVCSKHWPKPCECQPPHHHEGDERACWCATPPEPNCTRCGLLVTNCDCPTETSDRYAKDSIAAFNAATWCWEHKTTWGFCVHQQHKTPPLLQRRNMAPQDPPSTSPAAYTPTVDGEGDSPEVSATPAPSGEYATTAEDDPGEFAAVAVREVLADHAFLPDPMHTQEYETKGACLCDPARGCWESDWRDHVAEEVSRRINAAAADLRVTERLDASGFQQWESGQDMGCNVASEFFPQHQKRTEEK
jgi:hypothetical protein